MIYWCIKENNW